MENERKMITLESENADFSATWLLTDAQLRLLERLDDEGLLDDLKWKEIRNEYVETI